jgi:transcription elongation GreA/GreB family factor
MSEREELEKLVTAGKIRHQHVDLLLALLQSKYCFHRGWGFGSITELDPIFGRLVIDFPGKPRHSMDVAFAAESLKPLPPDHILVAKAMHLESLRQMVALDRLGLVRLVLKSYGGQATVDQIQQALVPDVIREDWKKWWEEAKRDLKKDGHFYVPLKRSELIVYQATEVPLLERLMRDFHAAKGLKARLAVASELVRNAADMANKETAFKEAIELLNAEIASHQRTVPALALEAIFLREDLRSVVQLPAAAGEVTAADIWSQVDRPARVLEEMPVAKHKPALVSFKQANPATWQDALLVVMNSANARLCAECARLLQEEGLAGLLKDNLVRLIGRHQASAELLLWLAKERSDAFADVLGPELFRAMLSAIERDTFLDKRSNRLRDYLVDDPHLIVELLQSADIEVIKDITRSLQLSPGFGDMDKRSLLARLVKHFPAVQSLISGEQAKQEASLIVSWDSLERRKREYDELVEKHLPEIAREIAHARGYGDLSENHEYKAAKEKQGHLMRRKAELESMFARARGTNFANPRTDVVSIGTRVGVLDLAGELRACYSILGAWDFDPERHCVSYLSPVAQALLARKVGDEVDVELEGVRRRYRIESIEAWVAVGQAVPLQPAPTPPPVEPAQASEPEAKSAEAPPAVVAAAEASIGETTADEPLSTAEVLTGPSAEAAPGTSAMGGASLPLPDGELQPQETGRVQPPLDPS